MVFGVLGGGGLFGFCGGWGGGGICLVMGVGSSKRFPKRNSCSVKNQSTDLSDGSKNTKRITTKTQVLVVPFGVFFESPRTSIKHPLLGLGIETHRHSDKKRLSSGAVQLIALQRSHLVPSHVGWIVSWVLLACSCQEQGLAVLLASLLSLP